MAVDRDLPQEVRERLSVAALRRCRPGRTDPRRCARFTRQSAGKRCLPGSLPATPPLSWFIVAALPRTSRTAAGRLGRRSASRSGARTAPPAARADAASCQTDAVGPPRAHIAGTRRDATRLRVRLEHVAARAAARNARPAHEAPRELQHRHGTSQLPPSRGIAPRRVHSPMASLVLDRPLTLAARRPGRRRRRQASRKAAERFESMPLTHVHQRHRQQREGSSAAPARSLVAARRPRPAARSSTPSNV